MSVLQRRMVTPSTEDTAATSVPRITTDVSESIESPVDTGRTDSWPKLDDAALVGLVGDIVRTLAPTTEADAVALLVQFLIVYGSILGRKPFYQVEATKHHTNEFAVLVGNTSKARKGTSLDRIRSLFSRLPGAWTNKCICSGLSSGEGLIYAVRDPIGEDPGVIDKRLLIVEPEFSGNVLKVAHRQGNTLSSVVRDAWDRGDLRTLTKQSPVSATGAHISVIGHTTEEEFRRNMSDDECANGFANRFMFFGVRRSQLLPFGGELPCEVQDELAVRVGKAIESARDIGRVSFDPSAREIWASVYPTLSAGTSGFAGYLTARSEAHTVRLAMLYSLTDGSALIHPEHLRAALALWEYAEASVFYIFHDASGDSVADAIMVALRDAGSSGLTRTAISSALSRNYTAGRVNLALQTLERAHRVVSSKSFTSGRPAEIWRAV